MRIPILVFLFLLSLSPARADLTSAQSLFEQGRATEALAEVERLLQRSPDDAETRFLQGIIFADLGRSNDAIEVFASLTQDFPELPEPYNNLAVLFAERGEFEKARDSLLAAIQTHPSYSTAHENLGDLYAKMAGIAYDRALEEDEANSSARLKLSAVNGLFAAPIVVSASNNPVQVARTEPVPANPVVTTPATPEPAIVKSEPIPEPTPEPVVVTQPEPTVVAIADPEPEPTPAPASGSEADAVRSAIRNWASAWASQDVDGYLSAYAQTFRPANGAPLSSWINYRRQRITAPSTIEVNVGEIDVEMIDSNSARAVFVQGYRSDNYRDQVIKTLTMERTRDGWQITSEVSEAM